MFGKSAQSVLLMLFDSDDPATQAQVGAEQAQSVEKGWCERASYYCLATKGTGPAHLALYESDGDVGALAGRRIDAGASFTNVAHSLLLERLAPSPYMFADFTPSNVTGLLLMANNPKTPGTDDAFNTWYDDVHRVDMHNTELYLSMNRFRVADDGGAGIRYLNLYDTRLADVSRALNDLDTFRLGWQEAGTFYADRENMLRGAYELVSLCGEVSP